MPRKSSFATLALVTLAGSLASIALPHRGPAVPSLQFSGADGDNVNHGSAASLDDRSEFTWYAWVYLDASPANNSHRGIISKLTTNVISGKGFWMNRTAGANNLRVHIQRATTPCTAQGGDVATGVHTFVALTYSEADGCRLWLGTFSSAATNVASGTGSGATSSDASANFYTGNRCPNNSCDSTGSWPGRIALVAFYDRRMSQAELDSHRLRPFCSASNGCLLFAHYWGVAADLSGGGNHGALTGATAAAHAPLARWP